jgi:succinate dehydrogenase / fumarate reductase cytochrome b subunit
MTEHTLKMRKRPKHLNLFQIRLPFPALVSILHRASGAILFLLLGLLLWLLQGTLSSGARFDAVRSALSNPALKLVLFGLLWAYLHHLLAGVRHLAMDLHYGTELEMSRASSKLVFFGALALTLIAGVALW